MPDLPDQVLDITKQVLFLRSACPWASKIILLASGHSQLKSMNCPKINFISLVFLCFSVIFLNCSSSSPKLMILRMMFYSDSIHFLVLKSLIVVGQVCFGQDK